MTTSTTQLQSRDSEKELEAAIENANNIVTKNYLGDLEQYVIASPSLEDLDIDVAEIGQFYHISKLVFNKDEHFLDKLTTIMNVAFSVDGSIVSIIKSDGKHVDYYIGIIAKKNRTMNEMSIRRREAAAAAFHGAIQGNLIGSAVTALSVSEVEQLQRSTFARSNQAVSSISGIVALRDGKEKDVMAYVQGIENLVDSLRNQAYTIVLVADPINSGELQVIKQGYELLYSQLASYWRSSITMNENDSISLSQAYTNGVTTGITKGISLTQSKTRGTNKSAGINVGVNAGIGIPGIGFIGGSTGINGSFGSSRSETAGEAKSFNESEQINRSSSNTTATTRSEGRSVQLNYENRSIKALLDKIDKQLERLEFCESFGAFDCAAYVIADNRNTALTVSSNYNALMRGEDSSIQASYINTWHKKQDVETLLTYLNSFVHPRFFDKAQREAADKLLVTPSSIINGKEMAIQIGLPKKSVSGISVIPMAPFGRNVRDVEEARSLKLGELYHMGQPDSAVVELDVQSLAAHTFVTGSTGSGKSNTIYHLLSKLEDKGISFLVIEPAKGEYKHIFGNRDDVNVFGTNPSIASLLRLNPFSFPDGIHVLEHIDRLIEIFNVCWSMYAAMPAVLKEAVEDAYIASGWDLVDSINENGSDCFPTFIDVMESLQKVISQSAYSDELKSNYKGSLLTRVKSLTNGLNGQMLCNGELSNEVLFDQRTIVDLHRVGSEETRSLMMGLLVMRLQEYRMTQGGLNQPLKHVTVLEEAHHLLKRTSTEQSMEGSNLLGKSVEMLANAIAEMRTYGEGFIIVDQAPGSLDASVIRNTNTKIILKMPDLNDRQLVGRAANLNDEQIVELAKLPTGIAAVYQNSWLEPVLCRMEPYHAGEQLYNYDPSTANEGEAAKIWRQQLIRLLLNGQQLEPLEVDVDGLALALPASALSTKNKLAIADLLTEFKQTKQLELWDRKQVIRLSALVSALIDERRIVDQILALTQETERLTDDLSRLVRRSIGKTSDKLTLAVCQCLLIDKAEQKEEWQRLYYEWDFHIRNHKLI
jgi:Predicted ATPase